MNCNRQSVIEVAPELGDRVIGHVATIPLRGDRIRRRYSAIDARGRRGRACRGHDGACAPIGDARCVVGIRVGRRSRSAAVAGAAIARHLTGDGVDSAPHLPRDALQL